MPRRAFRQLRPTVKQPLLELDPVTNTQLEFNIAILAAGAASRFGACKLLAPLNGKPVLNYSLDAASQTEAHEVFIITGGWYQEIEKHVELRNAEKEHFLYCQNWQEGMGASIKLAANINKDKSTALLIMLADQPLISAEQLNLLIRRWRDQPEQICCAQFNNTLGAPAIFPIGAQHKLLTLPNNQGAKRLLTNQIVNTVSIPEAAWDIDTPTNLAQAHTLLAANTKTDTN